MSVVVALGIILALGTAIGTQVADLAQDLPRYETTIQQKVDSLRAGIVASVSPLLGPLRRESPGEASPQTRAKAPATNKEARPAAQAEPPSAAWALKVLPSVLRPILNPLATFGIILVVTIFALLQKEDLRDRAIRLFGSSDMQRTTLAMDEAGRRLARYFLIQLGINTAFGLIVGTGLYWIGVPNPALWGIASALLRFIPYVGSWIAAALPLALAAATEPGWSMVMWTAALYAVVEVTLSQVVEPLVYGHSTGLSPFAVIVAAIFWAWLWGPIGLIISTPLTLCLVVLGRHIEHLEFIDVLLGDRPALSPVENLYQRMLANDPDEAVDQAEAFLKAQPLAAYYDDIVVSALRLAATDVQRGAMTHARIAQVRKNVDALVSELADYEAMPRAEENAPEERALAQTTSAQSNGPSSGANDAELPPAWQGDAPVLCIAGRGPLDEPVATMLAQLIEQRGLGARVVPNAAVSRETIASLDVDGVAMACVVYVEIRGHPAHLRLLLRRLRAACCCAAARGAVACRRSHARRPRIAARGRRDALRGHARRRRHDLRRFGARAWAGGRDGDDLIVGFYGPTKSPANFAGPFAGTIATVSARRRLRPSLRFRRGGSARDTRSAPSTPSDCRRRPEPAASCPCPASRSCRAARHGSRGSRGPRRHGARTGAGCSVACRSDRYGR